MITDEVESVITAKQNVWEEQKHTNETFYCSGSVEDGHTKK